MEYFSVAMVDFSNVDSFSERILVTYAGQVVGEHSNLLHLTSIAIGIAVHMPVKNLLERTIAHYFAQRKLKF